MDGNEILTFSLIPLKQGRWGSLGSIGFVGWIGSVKRLVRPS
jgi:hypothetical protein